MHVRLLSAALTLAIPVSAQNLVANGEFHDGGAGWSLTQFNDPLGTTGFNHAPTAGQGPSMAVFANFQTLASVMTATYRSAPFTLPAAPLPISMNVMWEKLVTTPIPQPTVSRVELRIFDATNVRVYLGTVPAPNQSGLLERATHNAMFTPPATGQYTAEIFMRHSNLAGIPFTNWVDDVVIGRPIVELFGQSCPGAGSFAPVISTDNMPRINTTNFAVRLNDAFAPTVAFLSLDPSNTTWNGLPLPLAIGGGCSLNTGLTILLGFPVTGSGAGSGTASAVLPIPNNPTMQGATLYSQWFVVDNAAANPFHIATTAAVGYTIQ